MAKTTYQGVIENGRLRLEDGVSLPDQTRVLVVVLEREGSGVPQLTSPRLARREDARRFELKFVEDE